MQKLFILAVVASVITLSKATAQQTSAQLPLILSDRFNDNTNQWQASDRDSTKTIIADGKLTIENFSDDYPWSLKKVDLDAEKDFSVSVSATHEAGYVNTGYGIVLAKDDSDYLSFKISSDGYYIIGYVVNGEWTTIADWKQSRIINKGNNQPNKLAIKHTNGNYEFDINNTPIEKSSKIPFDFGPDISLAGILSTGRQRVFFTDFELSGYTLQ